MPNLKPFRDYNEHEVLSLYAYSGQLPLSKGSLVSTVKTWENVNGPFNGVADLSPFDNTVSARFDVLGLVRTDSVLPNDLAKDVPIGITLKDVREYDENGQRLILHPQRLAELDAVLPNHAVPILTRGMVYVNDIDTGTYVNGGGAPQIGDAAYAGTNGQIAVDGHIRVGQFLSRIGSDGYALVKISL